MMPLSQRGEWGRCGDHGAARGLFILRDPAGKTEAISLPPPTPSSVFFSHTVIRTSCLWIRREVKAFSIEIMIMCVIQSVYGVRFLQDEGELLHFVQIIDLSSCGV